MTATRTPHPAVCVGLQERLPAFMDAMNDFQYIQVLKAKELIPSELGDVHEWKRIAKLLHFWADCDSTYHKTTFINKAQDDSTNPLARLYAELAKLGTSELLFVHQNHKGNADVDRFGRVKTPKARQSIDAPSFDLTLQLQAHDLTAFLQQCSVLFETIRDMALLEMGAVRAAIECEMAISDFEYIKAITTLHRLKRLPHNGATFHCHGYLCPAHVEKPDPSVAVKQHIRAANKTYFGQVSRYDEDVNGEFAAPWGVGTWPAGVTD
ncbi:hypothetical protein DYB28_000783 [Aphanomyces astaci]|uniref:Uncharacterized protein n=1 Tax=Aphanomyces astaci TaxID=112090 RepID=A0A397B5U8_APHAT|nr:hypothetical protein DYB36_004213 [Aphanomyces astaci]RHY42414.1 hypothetical protein DYB38_002051 [Aphanomyces astaci]RLO08709.1 hypothetical protein DYB28_000783 [Aphanomyces astaci]